MSGPDELIERLKATPQPLSIGPLEVLRTIMYELFYLDDLDHFTGIDKAAFNRLWRLYPPDRIQKFRMALDWAAVCHDFDYQSVLPDVPYTNRQIHSYLMTFRETLEDQVQANDWPDPPAGRV